MADTLDTQEARERKMRIPPGNDIPVRSRYRPPKRAITAPQPSLKGHAIRLAIASAIGVVLMFALLMLAIQYAQRDWARKNQLALTPRPTAAAAAEPTPADFPAASPSWTYHPGPRATARLLRHLGADPFIPDHWRILARGLADKPQMEIQLSSLRISMAVRGETAEARNDLGALHLQQKRMADAAAQFRAADQIRPGYAPARFNLALCALSDRKPAHAIQLLGQYLGQRPDDLTALRLQATLLSQIGCPLDALRMLERFLQTQSPDHPLFLEASVLAARLGQNGNAVRYLETAVNGNPIQSVIRTYQSSAFREIRLSDENDKLTTLLANKARAAIGTPVPAEDVQPLRDTTFDAKIR